MDMLSGSTALKGERWLRAAKHFLVSKAVCGVKISTRAKCYKPQRDPKKQSKKEGSKGVGVGNA